MFSGLGVAGRSSIAIRATRPPLYHRGLAYEQKGDVVHARADYTIAIKVDTTGLAMLGRCSRPAK
jgi:hypothetical protein